MKNTKFLTRHGMTAEVNIRKITYGDGPIGKKSAALRLIEPIVDSAYDKEKGTGLVNVPNIAITPGLFSVLLKRAGVSHGNYRESHKAIDAMVFPSSELDVLREAFLSFNGLYVAVRSDEWTAKGVGLTHTGFVFADDSGDSFQRFLTEVKAVLKSEFSGDVRAFKERMDIPLEETPGVLLMPLIGGDMAPRIFATPFSANVMTFFSGDDSLVSIGPGIGGANAYGASIALLRNLDEHDFAQPSPIWQKLKVMKDDVVAAVPRHETRGSKWDAIEGMGLVGEFIDELKESIRAFNGLAQKPKYLELALDPVKPFSWAVTQCADMELKLVEKPDVPDEQKVLVARTPRLYEGFGTSVFGRGTVETMDSVCVGYGEIMELIEANQNLRNYALFVDYPATLFREMIPFSEYSNAGTIIFCSRERSTFGLGSHLGGVVREAGILGLDGDIDYGFLAGLKNGAKAKVLVYANDAKQEGFVAKLD